MYKIVYLQSDLFGLILRTGTLLLFCVSSKCCTAYHSIHRASLMATVIENRFCFVCLLLFYTHMRTHYMSLTFECLQLDVSDWLRCFRTRKLSPFQWNDVSCGELILLPLQVGLTRSHEFSLDAFKTLRRFPKFF